MEVGLSLFVVFILILLNAFFVAVEFAVVKVRQSRIEQLVKEGNKKAKHVQNVIDNIDINLSAAQLGITLTSLGIGSLAEPAIASVMRGWLDGWIHSEALMHSISFILAFSIATFLHITIGEQVPKMLAIENAEKVAIWTAMPLSIFCKITYPIILLIKFSTEKMLRLLGVSARESNDNHSEEEIKIILSSSTEIEEDEQKMLNRIFDFNDRIVREIMVHRKDMECIYLSDDIHKTMMMIKDSNHSRFPVCEKDKDEIIGYVNLRDIYEKTANEIDLSALIREIPRIYEASTVPKALNQLKKEKIQMAIVVDEYGGVSGLVTMEDIVEEIVGDIQDEFDEEMPGIQETTNGVLVDAGLLMDEVNERFDIELEEIDGIDTVGGHVLSLIEGEPKLGSSVQIKDYKISIVGVDGHRILRLKFEKEPLQKDTKNNEEESEV